MSGLIVGLSGGLMGGLIAEIKKRFYRLRGRKLHARLEEIRLIEAVRWSWPQFLSSIIPNLGFGLIVGLIVGLINELIDGLIAGLIVGLISGMSVWVSSGFLGNEIERRVSPNQGIRRSTRNALLYGMMGVLIGGMMGG